MNEEDRGKRLEEVEQARSAATLLDNLAFRRAVKAIRDDCVRAFTDSALDDDRARYIARLRYDSLEDVITQLERHRETGRMAAIQLEQHREAEERKRAR